MSERFFGNFDVTDRNGRILESHSIHASYEEDAIDKYNTIHEKVVARYQNRGSLDCYIFMNWKEAMCRK